MHTKANMHTDMHTDILYIQEYTIYTHIYKYIQYMQTIYEYTQYMQTYTYLNICNIHMNICIHK